MGDAWNKRRDSLVWLSFLFLLPCSYSAVCLADDYTLTLRFSGVPAQGAAVQAQVKADKLLPAFSSQAVPSPAPPDSSVIVLAPQNAKEGAGNEVAVFSSPCEMGSGATSSNGPCTYRVQSQSSSQIVISTSGIGPGGAPLTFLASIGTAVSQPISCDRSTDEPSALCVIDLSSLAGIHQAGVSVEVVIQLPAPTGSTD